MAAVRPLSPCGRGLGRGRGLSIDLNPLTRIASAMRSDLSHKGRGGTERVASVNSKPDQNWNSLFAVALAQEVLCEIAEHRPRQCGERQRARDVDGREAEPRGEQAVEDAFAEPL